MISAVTFGRDGLIPSRGSSKPEPAHRWCYRPRCSDQLRSPDRTQSHRCLRRRVAEVCNSRTRFHCWTANCGQGRRKGRAVLSFLPDCAHPHDNRYDCRRGRDSHSRRPPLRDASDGTVWLPATARASSAVYNAPGGDRDAEPCDSRRYRGLWLRAGNSSLGAREDR